MKIQKNFNSIRKGSTFVKRCLFGGKIHIVKYTVIETHKGNGYICATDGMGGIYTFYNYDFEE